MLYIFKVTVLLKQNSQQKCTQSEIDDVIKYSPTISKGSQVLHPTDVP